MKKELIERILDLAGQKPLSESKIIKEDSDFDSNSEYQIEYFPEEEISFADKSGKKYIVGEPVLYLSFDIEGKWVGRHIRASLNGPEEFPNYEIDKVIYNKGTLHGALYVDGSDELVQEEYSRELTEGELELYVDKWIEKNHEEIENRNYSEPDYDL